MRGEGFTILVFLTLAVLKGFYFRRGSAATVTYDHRALVINGQRRVLLSGSIHYPRTTPDVISILHSQSFISFHFL